MLKKIAVVTGTRAEYGLLKPLMAELNNADGIDLQVIACAMHLSPEFGNTIQEIEKDGYTIHRKIECLLSSDTSVGISKSIGLANIGFADAFEQLNPDFLILLGDRTEILAAATTATVFGIPIGHIHGGETTEGAYDEPIRHAISKMSYYHFTTTDIYRKRVIQLGEHPERVFNVGAIGLDSIMNLKLLSRNEFEKTIGKSLKKRNFLITFHPVTQENNTAAEQFEKILKAVDKQPETLLIFTHANSDKDGRVINSMISKYVQLNKDKACEFASLGQLRYLSALQFIDIVIGNSSSGILEVPYFKKATINIGDRQRGRLAPQSVIHVQNNQQAIESAITKIFSHEFQEKCMKLKQLYGDGNTTNQIMSVLKSTEKIDLKKHFFDLPIKSTL